MCGIAGILSPSSSTSHIDAIQKMTDAITHRGPDARGVWSSNDNKVHLGHRRLSIIDLSAAGHQPMHSFCGRFHIVYNGEIYNHLKIREKLDKESETGLKWVGNSDTETLLSAISVWGFEETLQQLNGMFAIALWDEHDKKLFLARDRMGEKPLYYGWINNTFLFGSELKALKRHHNWRSDLDQKSLALYTQYSSIPAPHTIYKDVFKLSPAHYLTIDLNNKTPRLPKSYWQLSHSAPKTTGAALSDNEYVELLASELRDSISDRCMADVPLGAFLSGGIDSSLIVALMQQVSNDKTKTFTIGFTQAEYDEAPYAKEVASYLKTDHTELYVSDDQAIDLVPNLGIIYDEPFADSSQIPTLLLSQMTKQYVTVSLSGDGGDELFYGYSRYEEIRRIWKSIDKYPLPIRKFMAHAISVLGPIALNIIKYSGDSSVSIQNQLYRAIKIKNLLGSDDFRTLYKRSFVQLDNSILLHSADLPNNLDPSAFSAQYDGDDRDWMMITDMNNYLHDTVLTKVDRATMAFGLESRAPFLDHNIVEHAWNLPFHLKYKDQKGKWILREILSKHIPVELFDRPKMGFGVPIDHWLRSSLKSWAHDLLAEDKIKREGNFNYKLVNSLLHDHISGKTDNRFPLWNLLMFQSWIDNQ